MWRSIAAGVVLAALAGNAAIAAEFFVGRWASSVMSCTGAAESPTARPLIVTEYSVHRSLLSCRIGKMYKTGSTVHIEAYCASDGRNNSTVPVTLEPRGQRLGVIWNGGKMEEMDRCP